MQFIYKNDINHIKCFNSLKGTPDIITYYYFLKQPEYKIRITIFLHRFSKSNKKN